MALFDAWLDNRAEKKNQQAKQQIMNADTARSAAEFDRRMRDVGLSDGRITDLQRQEYSQTSSLEDDVFQFLMGNSAEGATEQLSIAAKAFDDQNSAFGGLMTATRKARLEQRIASDAEQARQAAIQGQADALASGLPQKVGFAAQQASYADALDQRVALAKGAMTEAAPAPGFAGRADPTLARAFEQEAKRGYGEALTDATNSAAVAARGDAFMGAERDLGDFAGAIDQMTQKAAISRSALPYELEVGATEKRNAQDAFDFGVENIEKSADARSGALQTYRSQRGDAQSNFGDRMGQALDKFFGRSYDSEGTYIDRLVNSSQQLDSKLTNLANFKMGNTTNFSPLAVIMREAEKAAAAAAKGSA